MYLFVILVRVMVWLCVFAFIAAALMLWAMLWIVVFILSALYVAFDESRGPKRLKRPFQKRRRGDDQEQDAFGQPVPQSRWSNRR